ncbi:hypothetical protein [Allocoleopsis franciscana]|uniref:hypothetical protein n=1 Tax=Allocoleopsis franciscana TaxID=2886352 RepID=UPI0012DF4569|nr:hypothetical protein [Allocoleopsis franciscana]
MIQPVDGLSTPIASIQDGDSSPEKWLKSWHSEQLRAADPANQPLRQFALHQPYWGACTRRAQTLSEALYSRIVDEKKRGEPNTNLLKSSPL